MRRYGLYDATRGLTTALAVGAAGLLLWVATQVGQQTTLRFWAEMGIVAGAGLVVAIAQAIGGWTKGLRLRLSPGTFALAFLPTLVVAGWILVATQPAGGWQGGTVAGWSSSLGVLGVVHDLGLWHGVLAFGIGLALGLALDTVPVDTVPVEGPALVEETGATRTPAVADGPVVVDRRPADEPLMADRETMVAEPPTVVVGPRDAVDETATPHA